MATEYAGDLVMLKLGTTAGITSVLQARPADFNRN